MKTYIVTQKILALSATYLVRETKDGPVLFTVKGKIFTFSPYLEMMKGADGEKTHVLKGNFFKTKFFISTPDGGAVGDIQFPFFAFVKSFVMNLGGRQYKAKGGLFAWSFAAVDASGKETFTIHKEFAFRDKFTVSLEERLPMEPVVLAAIAIDQRFFQNNRSASISIGT
ncbi:MAG: hypothetical protein JXD23_03795 [Spirochaetales bacterium]|nr:hypothetical protein [Spirochaetales bacterium]